MMPVEVGFRHLAFKQEIKHAKYINQLFLCISKRPTGGEEVKLPHLHPQH